METAESQEEAIMAREQKIDLNEIEKAIHQQ